MVTLVALISISTAWFIDRRIETVVLDQGHVIAQHFADDSVYVLLVPGDEDEVQSVTRTLEVYPGVAFVEVLDDTLRAVVSAGVPTNEFAMSNVLLPVDKVYMAHESIEYWHFVAPVDTIERQPNETQANPIEPTRLGYIHVAVSKSPVRTMVRTIVVAITTVAALLTLVLGFVMARSVRRLTGPLVDLQKVMVSGMESDESVRAVEKGPSEVTRIARVFNQLMQFRDSQSASLEDQVRERTRELEAARDAALTAEREKSEFMAMFTHEMKAPLHAMGSYLAEAGSQLDFISDLETAERIRQALSVISAESEEVLHRINQILDLRSLESGHSQIDLVEINLPEFLQLIDDTLRPIALLNNNSLSVTHQGSDVVRFDRDKLLQILENIGANACKFTDNGQISVLVENLVDKLRVVVIDDGVGIAPEHHENIFNAFYQVDMSDTREHTGTGLGLAIVKRLTTILGGHLSLTSSLGAGTKMVLDLPIDT